MPPLYPSNDGALVVDYAWSLWDGWGLAAGGLLARTGSKQQAQVWRTKPPMEGGFCFRCVV